MAHFDLMYIYDANNIRSANPFLTVTILEIREWERVCVCVCKENVILKEYGCVCVYIYIYIYIC